jgi:3-hydroxyisobutyrate dehydrogenase
MNTKKQTKVALLGLGAMGARMAARLAGEDLGLAVWSRSGVPEGAPLLVRRLAPTAQAAVKDADVVISMVTDDHASRSIWLDAGVLGSMRRGAIAVECSTLSPGWVSELVQHARGAGIAFVDAPVVGSRPQADAGNLIFLAGGETSVLDRLRPTLLHMGNAIHHLGSSPAGTYAKLLANALFTVQVATLAELLGFARRAQLDLSALEQALAGLPLMSPSAKTAMAAMRAGAFDPMFPLRLAAKDLRYATAAARATRSDMPMTCAASNVFERGNGSGLLEENLTAVAKLYAEEELETYLPGN